MGYLSCSFPTQQQRQQLLPQLTSPPSVYQLDSFRVIAQCSNSPVPPTSFFDRLFNNTCPYTNFLGGKKNQRLGLLKRCFRTPDRTSQTPSYHRSGYFLGRVSSSHGKRKLGLQTQILYLDDFRGWSGF
ncbi:hypothetical protein GQ457_02G021190 [Hibiscus cannabinus]